MAEGPEGLISRRTTVREAVARHPGVEAIFEKYGIMGCGGPEGPMEPIAFFARVHYVDPDTLVRELNDFVAREQRLAPVIFTDQVPPRRREFYFVPIAAGVALAVLAGFPLGSVVALGAVHDIGLGVRWTPLVQAHGHLQIMGWLGLFIMGVAYHVLPRFKASPLRFSRLVPSSFLLLLGGLVLRTASQPWGEVAWVSGLMVMSAGLELAGASAFAMVVAGTMRSGRREAYDAFLLAAVLWLVAAAVANLVVLADLATTGAVVIPLSKDEPLLTMQFYGFLVLFIFGVSLRVLPVFLNLWPSLAAAFVPALLLFNGGLALRVGTGWAAAYGDWDPPVTVEALGAFLIAGSAVAFALALNVYLPSAKSEIADPERSYARLIRAAYLWLALTAGLEVWLATRALSGGEAAGFLEAGGVRHALALGFLTQMIFGVGARVLPVFAGKRLYSQRLVDATFLLINVAAATRVAPAIIDVGSTTSRFDHMAYAGGLSLLAVALFGYNIVRTVTRPTTAAAPRKKGVEVAEGTQQEGRFVVTKDTVVAEVLDRVPGALELLISYGFTPLADPAMRQALAAQITLEGASRVKAIDLEALLRDLNRLAEEAAGEAVG